MANAWTGFVASAQAYYDSVSGGLKPHVSNKGLLGTDLNFMLSMNCGYLLFVVLGSALFKYGPMPDLKLTTVKMFHNLFLFLLSLYMCIEAFRQALAGGYTLFGNSLEIGTEPHAKGMSQIVWIFYLSKFYEYGDTVIMILTKKFNQVSFLHVYHHSTISAIWWAIATYAPGGDAYYSVILNSFVHVVMYAYYFFSGLGYKFLNPVKPYITSLQMLQFVSMLIQSSYDAYFPPKYPLFLIKLLGYYMITLLILFGNFFAQTYLTAAAEKKDKKGKAKQGKVA